MNWNSMEKQNAAPTNINIASLIDTRTLIQTLRSYIVSFIFTNYFHSSYILQMSALQ